ncbi:Zinc finger, RING-type, conserved site protein [Actinidia chinensis var. chinensis]|uniref:Zinc finger, RING-type, conserved site protein n=1 Tax=Actinidia chinensis var. chinensis TaxID=1590841 RepID=A0A2R6QN26_ACTCC|nr:Zinc finger, RING-type, conserved site protein [Actinidia chinensis var. chinensis]
MEVELVTEGLLEDDVFSVDHNIDDFSSFEGERCGICMDIVIDRGVLDCCQHWFCFTCIDNWATITNLCPLCQNEFQLITCVPVYDTIGSSKVDEDSFSREDDWCIEGKTNTLSFPSYYIDENAVICLGGDGCKIRNGSVTIEEDSNLDTSIACDSCDIWYHAFCVGFDPEGTCENSWLCPRCVANENPKKSDAIPALRPGNHSRLGNASGDGLVEVAFSGKVSVSVADAGETAVVVSMVEGYQMTEGPSEKPSSTSEIDKDLKIETLSSSSTANGPKLEAPSNEKTGTQPQELELYLSQDTSFSLRSPSSVKSELKPSSAEKPVKEPSGFDGLVISSRKLLNEPYSADELCESSLGLHLGLSVGCSLSVGDMKNKETGDMLQNNYSEEYLLPAGRIVPDMKDNVLGITGAKRKHTDYSNDAHIVAEDEETESKVETKASTKKIRTERNSRVIDPKDQAGDCVSVESQKRNSKKEHAASDIMSIVQGTDRRPVKGHTHSNHTVKSSRERETAAGLRMKKIMRRAGEDRESSTLLQKLRKEIREAVRNKTSKEFGENLFDPKLLAAFRAAVAGSNTEPPKKSPTLIVKAKKLLLQKGKIRENLTKKIYGTGGRRKRAWTRDCEIEFWKHRCFKAGKLEKLETLKSVLNLLRKDSDGTEIKQGTEGKPTNSILSRLYLADTSVFPRKEGIKPLSDLNASGPVDSKGHSLIVKVPILSPANPTARTLELNTASSQVGIPSPGIKGNKSITVTSIQGGASSSKVHPNKCPEGPRASEVNSQKDVIGKSNETKKDKRKWALEVLARKTASTGSKATHEKQEDTAVLKGNYPLVAQLPIDMRPVLAPSRHNKIPLSVRQAQLYRLTEHFLRKANLPIILRTADTELAVADAVNIEKAIADRSNSKVVYANLMSQELLHRSDNIESSKATEPDPSSISAVPADRSEQAINDLSDGPMVEEALKKAGLLSDSPPDSPYHQMEETNHENDLSRTGGEEHEPDNVFEMETHPELDIYGDFEYDLEDEDFIGASALKRSELQEEESKIKVVFSTVNTNRSNNVIDLADHERTTAVELPKVSLCTHECGTDANIKSSSVAVGTGDCIHQDPLADEGGEELSLAEQEELYGPDKEPLMKRFPKSELVKPFDQTANGVVPEKIEYSGSRQTAKASELGSESCSENLVVPGVSPQASCGENAPACSHTSENVHTKEKQSDTNKNKQSNSSNSISKKVEAYIKEHIRPLCKSRVITVEQYRWAVGKTTEKVMKYHSKEKNANFLIKEGEKVKKLAEQYVETAQQKERK